MIISLPFYISNFLSCFIWNKAARHKFRGRVNCFLYTPMMRRFIKKTFDVNVETIKFIRQNTASRCVCVINDKYFVKIFKHDMGNRLADFKFLIDYITPFIKTTIPPVYVSKNNHMYVTKKISGAGIYAFDKKFVLKHEKKILTQADSIILQLQSIDVSKIPNMERFCVALESTTKDAKPEQTSGESVLAHLDLNIRNFLFDDDLNICGLIDFDSLCIINDKMRDKQILMKYWERYKKSTRKHPL